LVAQVFAIKIARSAGQPIFDRQFRLQTPGLPIGAFAISRVRGTGCLEPTDVRLASLPIDCPSVEPGPLSILDANTLALA
jgi:hypothetical protein